MKHEALSYRSSVRKTTLPALGAAGAALIVAVLLLARSDDAPAQFAGGVLVLIALVPLALAASGWIVLRRLRLAELGATDLFLETNQDRRESELGRVGGFRAGALRRLVARTMLGHDLMVGGEVEIRSMELPRSRVQRRVGPPWPCPCVPI